MRNIKLTIEYLGTNYYGWQLIPKKPTIQGELLKALEKILNHPVKLIGASRTDAGVHAFGQVANFFTDRDIPLYNLKKAVNGLLPPDIKIVEVEEVPEDFHSRFSATGKRYLYRIFNRDTPSPFEYRRSWFIPFELNLETMKTASVYLIGVYDFSSFSKKDRKKEVNPIREINKIAFEFSDNVLEIRVWGRSFLRHMVRVIVATLVKVGTGKLSPEDVKRILDAKDRSQAPYLAPPDGLYLEKVYYDDYPF